MKRTAKIVAFVSVLIVLAIPAGYIASQQPKVWCDRQWAGIALLKGGYRSWAFRFCDGETFIEGKLQPVVITPTGYRKGYFRFPKYTHTDLRRLRLEAGFGLMVTTDGTNAVIQATKE